MYGYGYTVGNVDEQISIPKGQMIAGNAIGILCLDTLWQPFPPGCVMNACSFDFPVRYKIVEGMEGWEDEMPAGKIDNPKYGDRLIEAGKELQGQGVRAITGACGFLANYQKEVAAALDVPVFLSSLQQIHLIRLGLKPGQKLCVFENADLNEVPAIATTFSKIGIDDMSDIIITIIRDYPCEGLTGETRLVRAPNNVGHLNPFKVEQDLVKIAKHCVKEHPEIGAILLECACFPPYSWAVQNAVNLPVFDFYTLIDWIYKAVVRRPFSGFI